MVNAAARDTMIEIAKSYEHLALQAERILDSASGDKTDTNDADDPSS
jgi:hypothetical protein